MYAVPGPIDAPQSQSCNELIAKGEAALLTSPTVLVREYSGMMPEQAVQAFRRPDRRYPEPAARSAWEDIREREAGRTAPRRCAERRGRANSRLRLQRRRTANEDERPSSLVQDGVKPPRPRSTAADLAAPWVTNLVTMLKWDGILRRERADSSSAPGDSERKEIHAFRTVRCCSNKFPQEIHKKEHVSPFLYKCRERFRRRTPHGDVSEPAGSVHPLVPTSVVAYEIVWSFYVS